MRWVRVARLTGNRPVPAPLPTSRPAEPGSVLADPDPAARRSCRPALDRATGRMTFHPDHGPPDRTLAPSLAVYLAVRGERAEVVERPAGRAVQLLGVPNLEAVQQLVRDWQWGR